MAKTSSIDPDWLLTLLRGASREYSGIDLEEPMAPEGRLIAIGVLQIANELKLIREALQLTLSQTESCGRIKITIDRSYPDSMT